MPTRPLLRLPAPNAVVVPAGHGGGGKIRFPSRERQRNKFAQSYRIPLPRCLERVTDPRSLTVTLAWFSPIKPSHRSYRCVRLEAAPLHPPLEVLGVERLKGQPADVSVKRGSVFHEHFHGTSAVPFIEDGHLSLQVWCKEDAGDGESDPVRYGIAVTIEAETALPVYDKIQARLRVRPRPQP